MTFIVQSSSVFTSAITPLVGKLSFIYNDLVVFFCKKYSKTYTLSISFHQVSVLLASREPTL